jgi:hypothetical protein
MDSLVSVVNKRLTENLNPLVATLPKNRGWGVLWLTRFPIRESVLRRIPTMEHSDLVEKELPPLHPRGWMPVTNESAAAGKSRDFCLSFTVN